MFETHVQAWLDAKSSGNLSALNTFYASDFNNGKQSLPDWLPSLQREVNQAKGRSLQVKDLSLLHWLDTEQTMVTTFGEVVAGQRSGVTRRQYWSRRGDQWKIFYEGVI